MVEYSTSGKLVFCNFLLLPLTTHFSYRHQAIRKRGREKITKYKIQNTNKLQSQNYKLQTKEVPFGHIVYACGER